MEIYKALTDKLISMGKELFVEGDTERAFSTSDNAIQFNPTYAVAHYEKGNILFIVKSYFSAYEAYLKAAQLDKTYQQIFQEKVTELVKGGNKAHQEGDLQTAFDLYEYALYFDPKNIHAYNAKIRVHQELRKKENTQQGSKQIQELTEHKNILEEPREWLCEQPFRYEW